jgi:chaperonin GroEL
MAAKDVKFGTDARNRMLNGVNIPGRCRKSDIGPERP